MLAGPYRTEQICCRILRLRKLLLERDGIVDAELTSVFEALRNGVLVEVPGKFVRDIGEHEGGVVDQAIREDAKQSGGDVVQVAAAARDGAVGKDEDGGDIIGVPHDLSSNSPFVEIRVLNPALLRESRRVENANLKKRLCLQTTLKMLALTTIPLLLVKS